MNSSKPSVVVLGDAVGDLVVGADERGADAAAHQPDAGPHVRVHDEAVAVAAVQRRPSAAARPTASSRSRLARPRSRRRHARRAARRRPPTPRRRSAGRSRGSGCRSRASRPAAAASARMRVDALGHHRRRLAPREVHVDVLGRDRARPRRTRRRSRSRGTGSGGCAGRRARDVVVRAVEVERLTAPRAAHDLRGTRRSARSASPCRRGRRSGRARPARRRSRC